MAEQEGITVRKSENFSEWYTQAVLKSKLADYGPVQGTIVFREYSYEIWEKIQSIFNEMIKRAGHKNVYFPLLIPENFLKKEAEHFKGFVPEVFWVTQAGNDKLGERLAIRPTSETIIYYFFSKWIRSWRDLPILLNQWCNVLRAEIKSTKPFIRTSEFLWQEGHTAHATKEEADREVMLILNFYKDLIENYLAIPVLVGKKTEREKFAGALYTTTLEAIMPDGKALQMGTSHNLGQNFSKPFEIKFMDKDKNEKYVWTTSWGIATRLIGALVMVHGDDKGLIIPPKVAPYKVVIIPIYYKKKEKKEIVKKCKEILEVLQENKVEAILDEREEYTPGWKFNEWELKGVPLRVEVGPKDMEKKQIIVVRRDTNEKIVIKEKEIIEKIKLLLEEIQKNLFNKAKKFLEEHITLVKDYKEFKEKLEEKGGFIKACWCGKEKCEEKIKEETGATIRLIPFEKEKIFSNCVYCGEKAKEVVYFAKSY
ncbi:MAG: proline--tRNA ligase [Candidatus Aenigmarchaeota archaeon]|nr:proline--tRNA ligase [Candidatus Aenigmarchaeota archaeon]